MPVSSRRFIDALTARGFGPYLGVPCSFLRPFIDYVIDREDLAYHAATNEGEALAIAAGAELAGRRPVVMLQNSGLGNLVNPLTSLATTLRIPILIIVTLRGDPALRDEPQHETMGRVTRPLLDLLGVENAWFPASDGEIDPALDHALARMQETQLPFAFVLRKGVVDEYVPRARAVIASRPRGIRLPDLADLADAVDVGDVGDVGNAGVGDVAKPAALSRRSAVRAVCAAVTAAGDRTAIVATTGKIARELFESGDRDRNLYIVGSMGCAASVALGVALHRDLLVTVLDGDGAALMRLEAMATIGHLAPRRFVHVVLDNGAYESTGGQASIAPSIDFPGVALACGYAGARSARGANALRDALADAARAEGPQLIHAPIALSADGVVGRPTVAPPDVARRFRRAIAAST